MKNFLTFLIALVCAMLANAAEPAMGTAVLSSSATNLTSLEVKAGKSVKTYLWIDIQEEQDFSGLEADLYLPAGVEVVGGKESTLTIGEDDFGEPIATHQVRATSNTDGSYKITISGNTPLRGKKGSVAQINLKVAAGFVGGMAQFKNVIFTCVSSPNPFDSAKGVDSYLFPIQEEMCSLPVATVTANVNDGTMGSVSGAGIYITGETATLTANAKDGYSFTKWTDADGRTVSTDNPLVLTVDGDITITANFASPINVEIYLPTDGTGVVKAEWGDETNPAGNVVDIDATPNVHLYAFSGPETGWTEGETLPLAPIYNNGWAVRNNRNNIWDEALQATKTLYFVNGGGIPTTGVAFAMKCSDGVPTGRYRACYDKQKDPDGPWYAEDGTTPITTDFDYYYHPDGTTALPKYGAYYKVTPKLGGTIKILVWNNRGSRPVYVVDNDTRVALNPLAGEVKYSGYVNGKDEYIDPLDESKGRRMKFYENLVPQEGKAYVPQAEINANQSAWVYLTFPVKAGKTYWVFGGDAPLGFGGFEFTAEKDATTVYYSQDYENGAALDWSNSVSGRFDAEIGEDASGNHYMRAAAGNRTSNGSGMYTDAYSEKLAAGTPFTMTADIRLRSANGQNGTEFSVGAAGSSYSFSKWTLTGTMTLNMKQVAAGGTNQWILNGDADNPITLPGTESLAGTDAANIYDAAPWYSIQLTWKDSTTIFSIMDKATGTVIVDKRQLKTDGSFASTGGVGQLWFSTSRYNAAFAIDNVVIRDTIDGDIPVPAAAVVTANVNDETMGSVTVTGDCVVGATVTLTADAKANLYHFYKWTDASGATVSTDNPWTLTLAGDTTVTAIFLPKVEVQEEVDVPAITYDYALGSTGAFGTFDVSMVYDAIDCSAAEAVVYGYDPTTGDFIPEAMETFDGYFSAAGVPAVCGSTTPFCIRFSNDGTFWYGVHPDAVEYGATYTCAWILANPSNGDAVQYNFSMRDIVGTVVAQINAIGTVVLTDECQALIRSAREAYDALAAGQKALIGEELLAVLTEAEAAYAKLAADHAAADAVAAKINAIGTVVLTDECGALIRSAREAYDALTADQQALISEELLAVLTEAEDVFYNSSELSGDIVVEVHENLGRNEYAILLTMKAYGAKPYPVTLALDPESGTFVGTFTYDGEEETLSHLSTVAADGQELNIRQGSTVTITNRGNGEYTLSGTILFFNPAEEKELTITLDNLSFTTAVPAPNTLLTAGQYEMTATVTADEGAALPDELKEHLGAHTAQGELTGDSLALVITTTADAPFVLNGFAVKGDAVMLTGEAQGDSRFLLGDADGNVTGALAVTKTGEDEYAVTDGTIVCDGNKVGTVTGITLKKLSDPATRIDSLDAKAAKSGKYLEDGKIVIIRNGVKYGLTGF